LVALIPIFVHQNPLVNIGGGSSAVLDSFSVPEGSTVLLSFDYGPAYAAELDRLAAIIINKLTSQSAQVLVMSTHPLGMGSAEHAFSGIFPRFAYGEHYVFLGYLPGEEAGLRLLLNGLGTAFIRDYRFQQPLNSYPITSRIPALDQVDRVIVLAESAESVQRWVEQVNSQTHIPLDALVSVLAEPQLEPYYLSGQITTLAGGWPAALEYQALGSLSKADWGFSLGLAGLVVLVFVTVLVISIKQWIIHGKHR
ncbi:MAG: hypothetical protein ACYC6L_16155, partial [Anaerolineae bacterium]